MTARLWRGDASTGRRTVVVVIAMVLCCALASGCVAPAFDSGAFRRNAIHALDSAVGESRTGALAVQGRLQDRLLQTYADTVVTQSEESIGPVEDSFGAVDPPTAADDRLRDRVGALLSDTSDALSAARIALRQHDRPAMARSVSVLRTLADRMEGESQSLERAP